MRCHLGSQPEIRKPYDCPGTHRLTQTVLRQQLATSIPSLARFLQYGASHRHFSACLTVQPCPAGLCDSHRFALCPNFFGSSEERLRMATATKSRPSASTDVK